MALAYAIKNARRTPQQITWRDDDGTPLVLTGVTLTGRIRDTKTDVARDIDGTLTITDAVNGIFTWTYGALDVGTAGDFIVQFTATAGGQTDKTYLEKWRVVDAL